MKTTLTLWWKSNADVEAEQQPVCEYTPEQINEIEQDQADEDEEELLRMWA